jgi:hypothetical protein
MLQLCLFLFLLHISIRATNADLTNVELVKDGGPANAVSESLELEPARQLWQPAVGEKWQIILNSTIILNSSAILEPRDVKIFEVDLFDTPKSTLQELKNRGIKIICYFSAGTSEDWRPDFSEFKGEDKGTCLPQWVGERYVDIRKTSVLKVMTQRIALAAEKGCDAIDPDNIGM